MKRDILLTAIFFGNLSGLLEKEQIMRKVVYAMSVSLDGFIEAANCDLSWSYPDEELHQFFNDH
jgi:hypothetical protein